MQRIGLMGGSFNPIHCGHLNLGRACLAGSWADRVLFLPSGNPPHKREGLIDKMDRLAMVELAVEGEPGMGVCREEVDRSGVIYTVDTLAILQEKMPDTRFLYLIGADTLRTLHTWRRPEDVIRMCTLLTAMRPGEDEAQTLRFAQQWRERGADVIFMQAPAMDISSTEIRQAAAQGRPLSGLVPHRVEEYIRVNGLYREQEGIG